MAPRRRAAITGLGAVSGFGAGAELLFRSLLDGRRSIREAPTLAAAGIAKLASFLPGEDPAAHADRATPMALLAAREAVDDAGGVTAGDGLAVTVGTTLGGVGRFLEAVRGERERAEGFGWSGPGEAIATAHGARGPVIASSVACASGNAALGAALALVRSGRARQVIAGGVDALSDFVAAGFSSLKALDPELCRPFDRARRGLNLGEGACFLVVEDEQHARARGAPIRAFLDGYGSAADANHMTGPDREGRGAARAIAAALADAKLPSDEVGFVSAHGTATPFNDAMEGHALALALRDRARIAPVNSIKGAIGHTLGAAGAFEALLCVRSLEGQVVAPTAGLTEIDPAIALDVVHGAPRMAEIRNALSTSSGFGGLNAAIVIRRS